MLKSISYSGMSIYEMRIENNDTSGMTLVDCTGSRSVLPAAAAAAATLAHSLFFFSRSNGFSTAIAC